MTPQHQIRVGSEQVFVGRAAELQLLRTNLGWAKAGEPRIVVVEGPAGFGKSALLQAFVGQLSAEVQTMTASGDEAESRLELGVLAQLLVGIDGVGPSPGPGTDPIDAGARLIDALGTRQDGGPVVVVVDDAHLADAASLQALTFALRRLGPDRALVLIARRDGAHQLPDGLRRLVDARGQRVLLGGLDPVALAELAVRTGAGRLPVAAARRFCHHTGGSPLHARALLEQLGAEELRREAGPLPAPDSYALAVVSRLASTSAETVALVRAAAVVGERCALGTAARLAGLDDPSAALDEAVDARLLQVTERATSRSLVFSHPLVRSAVYHDLGPARRARLHAEAASLTSGAIALEHRVAATLVDDRDLAEQLATLAATEAQAAAWAQAAAHLVAAARLHPDSARRERLLLDAAADHLRAGDTDAAAALVEEVSSDSPMRRFLLGQLALLAGRIDDAVKLLEQAGEHDAALAAPAAAQLGQLALLQARPDQAVQWGRRALAGAGEDASVRSAARSVIAIGLGIGGRGEEALQVLEQAPATASEVTAGNAEWYFAQGILHYYTEDLAAAEADFGAIASAGPGLLRMRVNGLAYLAKTEYRTGQWDASVAHADLAVSLAEDADHAWAFAFSRSIATLVLAGRGEWAEALAHAEAAASAAKASGTAVDQAYAASALAQVAFAQADPARVVAAIEPVVELWSRDRLVEPTFLPWREQFADALVSLGRIDDAAAALAGFEARARARGRRSSLAGAARVRGRIEAAQGNLDGAESAFEEALGHLEGVPTPFLRALVQDAHGRHLRRVGQRRAGAAHLRGARSTYADLRARPFLERCDRELAACGLTPALRAHPAPVSLTPQELAAARLAASGATNREVAAELVVSVKTVEYHLGHVYTKLGISSRHRLAAALTGRDLGWRD